MLFNSLHFLVFFPVVTILFFLLPERPRWLLLLVASCYFYMAFVPVYILILVFTIVVDYAAGLLIAGASGRKRRLYLLCSLVANIGVLSVFKYYGFVRDTVLQFLPQASLPALKILLPIGLSFHTFQAMSYTIEVYRGKHPPERNFGIFALYVMFYPQLVAGPIERPQNLLPQFRKAHTFDAERISAGLRLILWGMFKKVVIADRLAAFVDQVYDNPGSHHGAAVVLATYFFAFQIYCDFSGYSDIALGCAQVMDFKLMRNFDNPYRALSIGEFWRRWHISLSTWFRDYLYIPLGGGRVAPPRRALNLMIVFLLSGLWHGANWTFVVWGAFHGILLVLSLATAGVRGGLVRTLRLDRLPPLYALLRAILTFHLVCVSWVFFRANNVAEAFSLLKSAGTGFLPSLQNLPLSRRELALSVLLIVFLFAMERRPENPVQALVAGRPVWLRWGVAYALVVAILAFGYFTARQFIYFQF